MKFLVDNAYISVYPIKDLKQLIKDMVEIPGFYEEIYETSLCPEDVSAP